ncbi:RusA family crossover junction endodeoxyribonuclease [Caballeronia sp. LZ035]|nr:RusA family crossover junction endodeoxyribonuclease [Caballeronia sp. LZ035]
MPRTIKFTVAGQPVPKGRPRASRTATGVRMRTPEKTARYERKVKAFAINAMLGGKPIARPVRLKISIVVPIPASWSKPRREKARTGEICATKKPDADNVLKAINDAMNGVVYADDAQVIEIQLSKAYGDEPRVEVAVTEIGREAA